MSEAGHVFHPGRIRAAAVIAVTILAAAHTVRAGDVTYLGALQFSTGDYIFTERTNSVYLMNGFSVSVDRAHVTATIPVIYQNTSLVSNSGPGMIPSGGAGRPGVIEHRQGGKIHVVETGEVDQIGLGDPVVRAEIEVSRRTNRYPSVSVAALAKAPVADVDRGFGTGEWDFGAGVTAAQVVRRSFFSAGVIYWVMGDPDYLELDNPIAYNVAVGRSLSGGRWSALASFSGYTQVVSDTDPFRQLGVSLTYLLEKGRSLSGSVSFGLTPATPDLGVSLGWGVGL